MVFEDTWLLYLDLYVGAQISRPLPFYILAVIREQLQLMLVLDHNHNYKLCMNFYQNNFIKPTSLCTFRALFFLSFSFKQT